MLTDGSGELGSDGARALADFLVSQATSIVSLHLNYCELGDEGVCILLEPFSASKQCLQELSLNCNEIGEEGGRALVRAMLPNLTKLHLELRSYQCATNRFCNVEGNWADHETSPLDDPKN